MSRIELNYEILVVVMTRLPGPRVRYRGNRPRHELCQYMELSIFSPYFSEPPYMYPLPRLSDDRGNQVCVWGGGGGNKTHFPEIIFHLILKFIILHGDERKCRGLMQVLKKNSGL